MRKMCYFFKRSGLLVAVLFVIVSIGSPYGLIMLQERRQAEDLFELREIIYYVLAALAFLACLLPMDVMRIYIGTKGNEVLLKDNRYPIIEAYGVGSIYLIMEILFFAQIRNRLHNSGGVMAAVLCLSMMIIAGSVAVFLLCESFVLTIMAMLIVSIGIIETPVFRVLDFPDRRAVTRACSVGVGLTMFFTAMDAVLVRYIRLR